MIIHYQIGVLSSLSLQLEVYQHDNYMILKQGSLILWFLDKYDHYSTIIRVP